MITVKMSLEDLTLILEAAKRTYSESMLSVDGLESLVSPETAEAARADLALLGQACVKLDSCLGKNFERLCKAS